MTPGFACGGTATTFCRIPTSTIQGRRGGDGWRRVQGQPRMRPSCTDVVRLRRWGVVGVPADVEVVVVLLQLLAGHDPGVAGDVLERLVGVYDLLDVLRKEVVRT